MNYPHFERLSALDRSVLGIGDGATHVCACGCIDLLKEVVAVI